MDVYEHFHHKGGRLQSAVAGRWKCLCTCASSQLSRLCSQSANWCLRNIVTVVYYPHQIITLTCHLFNSKTAQLMMHMSHKARDVLEQTPKPKRKTITTIMQRVTFLTWGGSYKKGWYLWAAQMSPDAIMTSGWASGLFGAYLPFVHNAQLAARPC